jgi:alkylation response protein AidB-like acyl-CoA dehydrogenase
MSRDDTEILRETLQAFRKRRVEAQWEKLNAPDAERYRDLWEGLHAMGVTVFSLPEGAGGVALDSRSRFEILSALGGAVPALAFGLVSHLTALSLLGQVADGRLPDPFDRLAAQERFALAGSPLDAVPETAFRIVANGTVSLSGSQRVALPYPEWIVVPAREDGRAGSGLRLCVVKADATGVRFSGKPSSHGLRLVPFGELTLDHVVVRSDHVFDWPTSGRAAHEADGLVAALLTGMTGELAERAMRYALERYQGGKMIHEHDAVQQLTGPIELARRSLQAVALAALGEERAGDGGASAFAIDFVRRSGLDAIQTFGGYGYMEDFRVERYLRDANTLETCWIHAASRQRDIARNRFAEMAR